MEIRTQKDFHAQMTAWDIELTAKNTPLNNRLRELKNIEDELRIAMDQIEIDDIRMSSEIMAVNEQYDAAHAEYMKKIGPIVQERNNEQAARLHSMKVSFGDATQHLVERRKQLVKEKGELRIRLLELQQQVKANRIEYRNVVSQTKVNATYYHNLKHELILAYPKGTLPEA